MSEKKILVKLVHSTIGRDCRQEEIVKGLGLRKLNSVRELEDTPAVRGMVAKIPHLVKIIEENVGSSKKAPVKKAAKASGSKETQDGAK